MPASALAAEPAAERLVELGELARDALGLDLGAGLRLLTGRKDGLLKLAVDAGDQRRERVGHTFRLVEVDRQIERRRLAVVEELEHALVEARGRGLRVEHAPPVVVARMRLDREDEPVRAGHGEVVVVDEPMTVGDHLPPSCATCPTGGLREIWRGPRGCGAGTRTPTT